MDPTEANETVPNSEEKPITEVLDFAMREIVKQDSLTDELICPMLRMVFIFTFKMGNRNNTSTENKLSPLKACPTLKTNVSDLELTIWVTSYFNNKFYLAEVS